MRTRYSWASDYCIDKDVVEIACGPGIGLGILARNARSVIGGDVDPLILKYGIEHYTQSKVQLIELDACNMQLDDNSVDVALCFEATYYFPSISAFLSEVKRILRPGSVFLCSSVNCQWHGFNASPFSLKYHSIAEMQEKLRGAGLSAEFHVGFIDNPSSLKRRIISIIRRIAVLLHLVPKNMKGKEFFKKLFYGNLEPLPIEMTDAHGETSEIFALTDDIPVENYKFYYFECRMP